MTGTDVATYTRERPGMSAFVLEDGVVYHTYSAYARGLDGLWGMSNGSIALPEAATRPASGGATTTTTISAERDGHPLGESEYFNFAALAKTQLVDRSRDKIRALA